MLAAHLAVGDVREQKFVHAERLRRADDLLAGFSEDDLHVWLDDWEIKRRPDGAIAVRAWDAAQDFGLQLEMQPTREIVPHGDRGYSRKGAEPGNASVYLSWTRMAVRGSLEVAGVLRKVEGSAWFDHEWGTSTLGEGVVGWDWFSLRLDDGRDLMVYRLRRNDGSADLRSSGTLVGPDGEVDHLERDEVEIAVLDWWQSPATGGRYPIRWRVRAPAEAIDLEVKSLIPGSELDGTATTGVVYWEGPVVAEGSATGEGYVEMTGYAGSLEGRF